jgi:L-ascorbate metabolism protein UlaG (beta-lactamase superfamily)
MRYSRRQTMGVGLGAVAGIGLTAILPGRALAQEASATGDRYPTESGEIVVHPVEHASLVLEVSGMVIYADPVGGTGAYEGLPPPDLILVTHEHGDHYDPETLAALVRDNTRLITNPAVYDMLPEGLRERATAMANGESTTANDIEIEAIPAYNTTEGRLHYHPEGRDNGYVLTTDGRRVYIAGDTEDIPEMRALEDIYVAFVPMNLPNTMTPEQAADGVQAFAPAYVYPYHYRDSDIGTFQRLVSEAAVETEVVRAEWYA